MVFGLKFFRVMVLINSTGTRSSLTSWFNDTSPDRHIARFSFPTLLSSLTGLNGNFDFYPTVLSSLMGLNGNFDSFPTILSSLMGLNGNFDSFPYHTVVPDGTDRPNVISMCLMCLNGERKRINPGQE